MASRTDGRILMVLCNRGAPLCETPQMRSPSLHVANRSDQGFQMPRRQVDDQSADLSFAYGAQLGGADFEVPVHRQVGLWVEILEAASGESCEVVPQQKLVLGSGQIFQHHGSPFTSRDLSCSSTFSSASLNSAVSGGAGSV